MSAVRVLATVGLLFGLGFSLVSPPDVQAQGAFPDAFGIAKTRAPAVRPKFEVSLEDTGEELGLVTLRIKATIPADHYIYATTQGAGGTATKIVIAGHPGLVPVEDAFVSNKEFETVRDDKYEYKKHYKSADWSRKFKIKPGTSRANVSVSGTLSYGLCNKSECLPEKTVAFDLNLGDAPATATEVSKRKAPALMAEPEAPPAAIEIPLAPAEAATPAVPAAANTIYRHERKGGLIAQWSAKLAPATAKPGEKVKLTVTAIISPKWHIYSPNQQRTADDEGPVRTKLSFPGSKFLMPVTSFKSRLPIDHASEAWPSIREKTFEGEIQWEREYQVTADAPAGPITFSGALGYQACSNSECVTSGTNFEGSLVVGSEPSSEGAPLLVASQLTSAEMEDLPGDPVEEVADSKTAAMPVSQAAVAHGIDKKAGMIPFLITAILSGLAALATPCVFPMVPITVSIFQKQAEKQHHSALLMAFVYCGTIVGTFTLLGLGISMLFGATALNQLANNVWLNLLIGTVLVAFACNLMGMFDIIVPSWMLNAVAGQENRGGYVGVVFMALTFTLTSFTCTFAFVGQLLAWAAAGDILWPLVGLMAFSIAFAAPFFFLALFPRLLQTLPKAGGWMNTVKVVMGLLELGAAVKFLSVADVAMFGEPVLFDFEMVIMLWAVLAVVTAAYLFGLFRTPHDSPTEHIGVGRILGGTAFLTLAAYMAVGVFSQKPPAGPLWQNIAALGPPRIEVAGEQSEELVKDQVIPPGQTQVHGGLHYSVDLEQSLKYAKEHGLPVFLDFTGVNCVNCRLMENGPLKNPDVIRRLSKFVRVSVYLDVMPKLGGVSADPRLLQQNLTFVKKVGDVSMPSYGVLPGGTETLENPRAFAFASGFNPDVKDFTAFLDDGYEKWSTWKQQNAKVAAPKNTEPPTRSVAEMK